MSSLTWRLDGTGDDQNDLPACTSCRKRKLRCSRQVPACDYCSRTGAPCIYDAKSRPGVKVGAVEALSRRLAKLEQLLFDEQGEPFVTFNPDDRDDSSNDGDFQNDTHPDSQVQGNALEGLDEAETCSHGCERPLRGTAVSDGAILPFRDCKSDALRQALPSRKVLIAVVDYFCTSFHHWIPFLHKAKTQAEVQRTEISPVLVPILHALVAVVLPRLNTKDLDMNHIEIHKQTQLSSSLALQYSVMNANLQSLQTLVILVFEKIMDGEILQTCQLIALLVRTVDFLQLTTEPGTKRSHGLMKPLETLDATTDWTELEARRRLFWVIFAIDRWTSAHTGWNTSLTAEDVHRRLPADGNYFTREMPVTCPFFGLWRKAYANFGSPLTAHIPSQYQELSPAAGTIEPDSTSPESQGSIDASKLGAFAYSIEAVESLNQVTTFFLQQRIDWQNRQHVLEWLTRFKELDLRLIHWKLFLPARWKDSDISMDVTRIDMDPNLTLAHLTHNASMILLHYPVAFARSEWTAVVRLPSECSRETCIMAAIEISRISKKFLQNTVIPFVNPQFSFCVYVAAKLLLASSHKSGHEVALEYHDLRGALQQISEDWLQRRNEANVSTEVSTVTRDLAATYAISLDALSKNCERDRDFEFDFFNHSGSSQTTLGLQEQLNTTDTPDGTSVDPPAIFQRPMTNRHQKGAAQRRKSRLRSGASTNGSQATQLSAQKRPPRNTPGVEPTAQLLQASSAPQPQPNYHDLSPAQQPTDQFLPHGMPTQDTSWPMFDFSDTLMHPEWMQQDRVITFEDSYFQTGSNMDWS